MEDVAMLYSILVANGPVFAAALIGIVVALVWWPKAPLPAKLVLVACVLEMLLTGMSAWMSGWYVPHMVREGNTMQGIRTIVTAISVCASVLRAVLFGLLIWAAFAGRDATHPTLR
ncbi:hypothetical protein [Dyella kyungheensis]|uniref:Uncharacterized protein n=1 Tax=Dyella kyungheensis TaxID=1242174 RepID=A0ABS2JNE0_9GAMM|nr:hypothetical protein [Dyella kyungheensis]MBM7120547.1 hypothetical protein [Dyella kyungheensis]